MALFCIICEIWRVIGRNREIFIAHLYLALLQAVTLSEFREDV